MIFDIKNWLWKSDFGTFWQPLWTSVKVKSKNYSYFTDFFAKVKRLLTHVRKTPPLRSPYKDVCLDAMIFFCDNTFWERRTSCFLNKFLEYFFKIKKNTAFGHAMSELGKIPFSRLSVDKLYGEKFFLFQHQSISLGRWDQITCVKESS